MTNGFKCGKMYVIVLHFFLYTVLIADNKVLHQYVVFSITTDVIIVLFP
jgi:hypothetical protein